MGKIPFLEYVLVSIQLPIKGVFIQKTLTIEDIRRLIGFNPTPYQGSIYRLRIISRYLSFFGFNPTPYQGSIYTKPI